MQSQVEIKLVYASYFCLISYTIGSSGFILVLLSIQDVFLIFCSVQPVSLCCFCVVSHPVSVSNHSSCFPFVVSLQVSFVIYQILWFPFMFSFSSYFLVFGVVFFFPLWLCHKSCCSKKVQWEPLSITICDHLGHWVKTSTKCP